MFDGKRVYKIVAQLWYSDPFYGNSKATYVKYDFLYGNVDPWAHYPMESPVHDLTFSYKIGKNQSGFKRHRSHHISPNMVIEDDPCHSPPHMPAYLGIIGYYSSPIAHVLGKHSTMSHDIGNN